MTDIQEKRLELLKEIHEICTQQNIKYFLYGSTALSARRDGVWAPGLNSAVVVMPSADCLSFIQAVEQSGRQDRYVEYMGNSPHFFRTCVVYGNRNTLSLRTDTFGRFTHHGITVIIEILRPVESDRRRRRWNRRLETGWEVLNNPLKRSNSNRKALRIVKTLCGLMGRKRFARWLFARLVDPDEKGTGKVFIKRYGKRRKLFAADSLFRSSRTVTLEGAQFCIPAAGERYMQTLYGMNWEERVLAPQTNPGVVLEDANIPYEDYFRFLQEEGVQAGEVWSTYQSYIEGRCRSLPINKQISGIWNRMFLAGERFNLWEYYMPRKPYLRELYRVGDVETMAQELELYITSAREYVGKGLGLCFDREMFEWLEYVLVSNRQEKLAARIRKAVPKHHWKRLTLMDWQGNPIQKKKEEKGMRRAQAEDIPAILTYLRQDVGNCVYLYIDVAKYGLSNPNMELWLESDKEGIQLVVMRYYDSITVYSRTDRWDTEPVCRLIAERRPGMVSGQDWIIQRLYPDFQQDYQLEVGYVFQLNTFRPFDAPVPIEAGREEDVQEIAALICSNESIGGYYDVDNLASQLKERMQTHIGRSLVIRREGKIVAHIATYAEFEHIAVTAGLISTPDETNIPYGTLLESRLVLDLLDEGYQIYTFVTEKRRAMFFKAMDCTQIGRYGKMTLKE